MSNIMYVDDRQMASLKKEITGNAVTATITAGEGGTYISSVSANEIGAAIDSGYSVTVTYGGNNAMSVTYTKLGSDYTITAVFDEVNSAGTGLDVRIFSIEGTIAMLTEESLTFAV